MESLLRTRQNTCFFTGHRFIPEEKIHAITQLTREQIYLHAAEGYRYFICGGARGFDTIAAMQVCRIKASGRAISLILALPCRDQTALWKELDLLKLYQRIKSAADEIIYVNDLYEENCMRERNRYMVDSSGACIAYYNHSKRGGTAQTIRLTKAEQLPIANIFDNL